MRRCRGSMSPTETDVEAPMRWLVGWSSVAASYATTSGARAGSVSGSMTGSYGGGHGGSYGSGHGSGYDDSPSSRSAAAATEGRTVQPVGAQLLWGDPDPCGRSATGARTRSAWWPSTTTPASPCSAVARPPTRSCGSACSPRAGARCGISRPGPAATRRSSRPAAASRSPVIWPAPGRCSTPRGRAAPPTPPPPCRSPTSSRPSSTSAISGRCSPAPRPRRRCATPPRTRASGACRPATR